MKGIRRKNNLILLAATLHNEIHSQRTKVEKKKKREIVLIGQSHPFQKEVVTQEVFVFSIIHGVPQHVCDSNAVQKQQQFFFFFLFLKEWHNIPVRSDTSDTLLQGKGAWDFYEEYIDRSWFLITPLLLFSHCISTAGC